MQTAVRTLAEHALAGTKLISNDVVATIESLVAELEIKLRQQAQILMSLFETGLALPAFLRRLGSKPRNQKGVGQYE